MIPRWFVAPIHPGDEDPAVTIIQRKIGAPMTGELDNETVARVKGVQKKAGLEQTGVVDEATAEAIGEKATAGHVPAWFTREVKRDDHGLDVTEIRRALRQADLPVHYDDHLENLVRQFQSAAGMTPTGVVDEATAVALADRSA